MGKRDSALTLLEEKKMCIVENKQRIRQILLTHIGSSQDLFSVSFRGRESYQHIKCDQPLFRPDSFLL